MDKKSNMKQAMFEMFGVGADQTATEAPTQTETPKATAAPVPEKKNPVVTPVATPASVPAPAKKPSFGVSYLAAGTVLEGTLRAEGDIEIAGEFKGDITTKGTAILHSDIDGNVTANSLSLCDCTLTGDVVVTESIIISQNSKIKGNVTAKEVNCAGQIIGDLKISGNMTLEKTATVNGNMVIGSMSVAQGAVLCGGIEIKTIADKN